MGGMKERELDRDKDGERDSWIETKMEREKDGWMDKEMN
jgi:hypothetical protein